MAIIQNHRLSSDTNVTLHFKNKEIIGPCDMVPPDEMYTVPGHIYVFVDGKLHLFALADIDFLVFSEDQYDE